MRHLAHHPILITLWHQGSSTQAHNGQTLEACSCWQPNAPVPNSHSRSAFGSNDERGGPASCHDAVHPAGLPNTAHLQQQELEPQEAGRHHRWLVALCNTQSHTVAQQVLCQRKAEEVCCEPPSLRTSQAYRWALPGWTAM